MVQGLAAPSARRSRVIVAPRSGGTTPVRRPQAPELDAEGSYLLLHFADVRQQFLLCRVGDFPAPAPLAPRDQRRPIQPQSPNVECAGLREAEEYAIVRFSEMHGEIVTQRVQQTLGGG